MLKIYITLVIAGILINSCSSTKEVSGCIEEKLEGSLTVNSVHNEYMPSVYNDDLYFLQSYIGNGGEVELLVKKGGGLAENFPKPMLSLNIAGLEITSSPSFYFNPNTGFTEIYFSAINKKSGKDDENIYFTYGTDDKYNFPVSLSETINTEFDEGSPSINASGDLLAFSSKRDEGTGFDIYICNRINEVWSRPIRLGAYVNTEYDEITPTFSENDDLYFSSNGYSALDNYDIIKSEKKGSTWDYGKLLPYPFNTAFDEKGVSIQNSKMFLGSNREGGCGEYDLYSFSRCGLGSIDISIYSKDRNYPAIGKFELFKDGELIEVLQLDKNGAKLILEPGTYNFDFTAKCMSDGVVSDEFEIICDEELTNELRIEIAIPEPQIGNFSFEEYNVPFFVTGYYMPNTTENLENLKLKFKYNQMDSDTTSYIENPVNKYDMEAQKVDIALNTSLNYLQNKVNNLSTECANSDELIKVQVIGFADPRPISKGARYFGPTITDLNFDFQIDNGTPLDNKLLSKLRAYYTAKFFERELLKNPNYTGVSFRFIWDIRGLGVDPYQGTTYDYNRRVKISVESVVN